MKILNRNHEKNYANFSVWISCNDLNNY